MRVEKVANNQNSKNKIRQCHFAESEAPSSVAGVIFYVEKTTGTQRIRHQHTSFYNN